MKTRLQNLFVTLALLAGTHQLCAQGTAFTYQGRLNSGATPATGSFDLRFALYDAATDGTQQGLLLTNAATAISNGLFTVTLDFGNQFPGAARWLEIGVRTNGVVTAFSTLAPRQPLTPTPYATYAASAAGLLSGFTIQTNSSGSPNVVGGAAGNYVRSGVIGATISGGGSTNFTGYAYTNTIKANFGTIGGGLGNTVQASFATVCGGWLNTISSSGSYSTVCGGYSNNVYGQFSIAGGGYGNTVSGSFATAGGGIYNYVSGNEATLGGGEYNTAGGDFSTVSGGYTNVVSGNYSTIVGGSQNSVEGQYSTELGGLNNDVSGSFSCAAGSNARVTHNGSFAWGDPIGQTFSSTANNEFAVRATGGVRFVSASSGGTPTAGVSLAPGSGTWASLSDRNAKENFQSVNAQAVLQQVAALPVTSWNYKTQAKSIRHLGPMAQDFYAAFAVGEDERHITEIDESGVALAAIQGLNQKLNEKDAEIEQLKAKADKVDALEKQLNELEATVKTLAQQK
jgi:hypothetical protein